MRLRKYYAQGQELINHKRRIRTQVSFSTNSLLSLCYLIWSLHKNLFCTYYESDIILNCGNTAENCTNTLLTIIDLYFSGQRQSINQKIKQNIIQ